MLTRVHSLITFDSPLRGISSFAAIEGFYGAGSVWSDLNPASAAIRAITDPTQGVVAKLSLPGSTYSITTASSGRYHTSNRVYTISNRQDRLIYPQGSWLPGARANNAIDTCAGDVHNLCHITVLSNPTALQWATSFVKTSISARPTPTTVRSDVRSSRIDPVFVPVLPALRTAGIPLMLPTGLRGLNAGYHKVVPGYYWVELDSQPNCHYRACYVGGVGGQRGSQAPTGAPFPLTLRGTPVHLRGGITGYFLAGAQGAEDLPIQVAWEYKRILYQVFLKVGDRVSIVKLANSAISPAPRT